MNINQIEKKKRYMKRKRAFDEAKSEALEQMIHTIDRGLSMQMELVMLLVLRDKFGFGAERCTKALVSFEELWHSVGVKRLELDDIESVIKEEMGLVIEEEAVYKLDAKGNKKIIWQNKEDAPAVSVGG